MQSRNWTLIDPNGFIVKSGKGEWPSNPPLWSKITYVDPIGGATYIVYEYCGVAGWRFVSRD